MKEAASRMLVNSLTSRTAELAIVTAVRTSKPIISSAFTSRFRPLQFPSELIWYYGSYRQFVGLLGLVISPVSKPLTATNDNIRGISIISGTGAVICTSRCSSAMQS
jgi:hypothetical protein